MKTLTIPVEGYRIGDIWVMPDSSLMVAGSTISLVLSSQRFDLMVVSVEDDGLRVRKKTDDDTDRMTSDRRAKVGVRVDNKV